MESGTPSNDTLAHRTNAHITFSTSPPSPPASLHNAFLPTCLSIFFSFIYPTGVTASPCISSSRVWSSFVLTLSQEYKLIFHPPVISSTHLKPRANPDVLYLCVPLARPTTNFLSSPPPRFEAPTHLCKYPAAFDASLCGWDGCRLFFYEYGARFDCRS